MLSQASLRRDHIVLILEGKKKQRLRNHCLTWSREGMSRFSGHPFSCQCQMSRTRGDRTLAWERGDLGRCGSFFPFHFHIPHGGVVLTLLWWDGQVRQVHRAPHACWEGSSAGCWGRACRSTRTAAGVRMCSVGGWQGMLLGGPPAIRSPPGEAEVLESQVPLPPKSHLGQDMEFEVPPRSAEQECCGRT